MDKLIAEVKEKALAEGVKLAEFIEEDALINGMFAQVGWKFLVNRGNAAAFEAAPNSSEKLETVSTKFVVEPQLTESYNVNVDGRNFNVVVGPSGSPLTIKQDESAVSSVDLNAHNGAVIYAPMAGNVLKILVTEGSVVNEGEIVVLMEAMKMETEVRSKFAGIVSAVHVKEGAAVAGGNALISL